MLPTQHKWFSEVYQPEGLAISWTIESHLAHEVTDYQTIDIYQTSHWGHLMVIDDCVMLTSRDNFLYHEMLTHPALFSHPDPKTVLIIGGGDCGTLKEVLAHPGVVQATQVEIDEQVTRLSEKFFPELCERNQDPRAQLLFADGLAHIKALEPGSIDVIIIDSTDPIGPAEGLFGPDFVKDCHAALGHGGVLAQQSESPLLHGTLIEGIQSNMHAAGFSECKTLGFPQPCYPSGWWSATLATKGGKLQAPSEARFAKAHLSTRYYNPAVHAGALATQLGLIER